VISLEADAILCEEGRTIRAGTSQLQEGRLYLCWEVNFDRKVGQNCMIAYSRVGSSSFSGYLFYGLLVAYLLHLDKAELLVHYIFNFRGGGGGEFLFLHAYTSIIFHI
jgi:hypothetical protein